jgi:hypothetical protein
MNTRIPSPDPHIRMADLERRLNQHETDIFRLWNTAKTNRMWVNQTNQPGGASSISSSSSSSSSYSGDSDPPDCPDAACDFSITNTTTCCCAWTWYGSIDGWLCTGATVFCNDPCYDGSLGCANCTDEPSTPGEYMGQICYMAGIDCTGGPPVGCPCGYCLLEWDGDEWISDGLGCTGGCFCFPGSEPDGEFVGQLTYRCCEV